MQSTWMFATVSRSPERIIAGSLTGSGYLSRPTTWRECAEIYLRQASKNVFSSMFIALHLDLRVQQVPVENVGDCFGKILSRMWFAHFKPQVATVLDQFHKFLGPELKAVTGESAGIDEIMDRVDGLALPLNKVGFNSSPGPASRFSMSTSKIP